MGGFTSSLNVGRAHGPDTPSVALTVDPDQAVVAQLATPAWDAYAETVSVLYDASAGHWKMWFLGYAAAGFQNPGLGQMESVDADGLIWQRPAAPIYQPSPTGW